MNKQIFFIVLFGSLLFIPCSGVDDAHHPKKDHTKHSHKEHSKKRKATEQHQKKHIKKKKAEERFWFRYKDEPLVDIINELAKRKNINVVLPAGKEAVVNKLTFQYPEKITLSEAWRRMLSVLKICGYTITNENDFYFVTGADPKRFRDANRQPYPLYSHIKAEDLPDSDEKIRYIHYFSNLQVGGGGGNNGGGGLTQMIKAILSKDATIVTDPSSNGLVITDFARNIASAMHIVNELDSHGFTDGIDFIQLKHTSADTVARLFQELINSNAPQQGQQYGAQQQSPGNSSESQYFSKNTRIVAEMRSNSLILMGKKEALDQAKSFIEKNIDIPLGVGESVLHIYDLQYLKAKEFQPILQNIVSSSNQQQQGSYGNQSSGSVRNNNGEQYFQGVIIAAEQTGGEQQNSSGPNGYWGGTSGGGSTSAPAQAPQTSNRLIIAARRQDWIRIEKLIEELDKPQLQVAIEALIVDLTITGDQSFASQMRNKKGLGLKNTNFQTSNIGEIVLDESNLGAQSAEALRANLLNMAAANEGGQPSGTTLGNATGSNLITGAGAGSLLLSFKDKATNGMWLIAQLLSNFKDVKVLSQPFIVAMNNQNSSFASSDSRLLDGDTTTSLGGTVNQKVRKDATLGISVTPLISHGGKINLGIHIKVEEYGAGDQTFNRNLQTNANINDGEVLVLGGLTKTKVINAVTGTPGFKDIPLFGWLFKSKSKVTIKEHLLIFLCPRIIHTSPNKYFDPYTREKMLAMNKGLVEGENFDTLKDPITHWFFGSPDSDIASKRIHAFNDKNMYSSNKDYFADKQRVGVKNITVNPKKQVDHHSVMKTAAYIPPPAEKTSKKAAEEKAIENYIKVDRPTKKTYVAQSNKKEEAPKIALSEEEELKKLFASLNASTV